MSIKWNKTKFGEKKKLLDKNANKNFNEKTVHWKIWRKKKLLNFVRRSLTYSSVSLWVESASCGLCYGTTFFYFGFINQRQRGCRGQGICFAIIATTRCWFLLRSVAKMVWWNTNFGTYIRRFTCIRFGDQFFSRCLWRCWWNNLKNKLQFLVVQNATNIMNIRVILRKSKKTVSLWLVDPSSAWWFQIFLQMSIYSKFQQIFLPF